MVKICTEEVFSIGVFILSTSQRDCMSPCGSARCLAVIGWAPLNRLVHLVVDWRDCHVKPRQQTAETGFPRHDRWGREAPWRCLSIRPCQLLAHDTPTPSSRGLAKGLFFEPRILSRIAVQNQSDTAMAIGLMRLTFHRLYLSRQSPYTVG